MFILRTVPEVLMCNFIFYSLRVISSSQQFIGKGRWISCCISHESNSGLWVVVRVLYHEAICATTNVCAYRVFFKTENKLQINAGVASQDTRLHTSVCVGGGRAEQKKNRCSLPLHRSYLYSIMLKNVQKNCKLHAQRLIVVLMQ